MNRPRHVDAPGWGTRRLLGRRSVRLAVGAIWLLDGILQAAPNKFDANYPLQQLAQSVMGAPQWVNRTIYAGIDPFVAHWALWNLGAALLQVAIGICLITDRLVKPAIVVSAGWALVIWWLGEGFGMLPSGFAIMAAGAPGAVLLYPLLCLLAWPRADRADVSRSAWSASWAVLWVGSALLQIPYVYSPFNLLRANVEENANPIAALASAGTWFTGISEHHAVLISAAMGIAEGVIGVACLVDRRRLRWWLALAILVSLFYWVVVQQLGGLPSSLATDPNLGPLVVILALAAWPRRVQARDPTAAGTDGSALDGEDVQLARGLPGP